MDSIPVVDIAPFAEGSAKDREAVARQVDGACSNLGACTSDAILLSSAQPVNKMLATNTVAHLRSI